MMPPEPNPPRRRVTMRTVAERAGVSVQAVSLALRNHPSIGAATRARVQALARAEGYVPDPHLTKLMRHLRGGGGPRLAASVAALTTRSPKAEEKFCDLLLAGAQAAARAAGFTLHVLHADGAESAGGRLGRVLRQRGVEGLVLLPMAGLETLDGLVDWREFAVVAATLSVASPQFDRVVADHFRNNFALHARLRAAGYRRPGLVVHAKHDERCGHCLTAAQAWHGLHGGAEAVRAHVVDTLDAGALRRWLRAERPDVVLTEHDAFARELAAAGAGAGGRPIVSCSARPREDGTYPFPGNDDRPGEIGAEAVGQLARMIAVGQRGVPVSPRTTLVRGAWAGELAAAG